MAEGGGQGPAGSGEGPSSPSHNRDQDETISKLRGHSGNLNPNASERNVSFDPATIEGDMPRKRSFRHSAQGEGDGTSSADESAPIIQHQQGTPKDYQSISPSIGARSSGVEDNSRERRSSREVGGQRERGDEREAQRAAADTERKESKRWRKWLEKYGSVELENKGSVARDHLALERTFLAWLRTSLSFASIGIAITQLFRLNTTISSNNPTDTPQARLRHVGKPLGATFIAISILVLFIGFHRYFEAQHYVIRGKFPASRGSVLLVTLVAGALIVSSLVVILAVAPKAFEKR